MNFRPVDRLPHVEWAGWWDKTIERWHEEGLPHSLTDAGEIREYLGLDVYRQMGIGPAKSTLPPAPGHGKGIADTLDGYQRIREHLYPGPEAIDRATAESWAAGQARGEMVIWITLSGFFWFPRTLMGIERHLSGFYEAPEVMHAMNEDLVAFNMRSLDAFCAICVPDFMTFAEDMSYNNGPMISKDLFDTFMAPYYRRIIPRILDYGIIPFIDTDGDIGQLIPWFLEVGVDGFLPLERQAGCDIAAYRQRCPRTRYIGAYDKMVMDKGEAAMRAEFERLLPVMRQGGFIPSCDHQTPPGVSLENYRLYLHLMREFCLRTRE
jgi:hypothetical protein